MNVSEILDIVSDFSIGAKNVDTDQRKVFLNYLNLYKDFLYRKSALLNQDILNSHIFNEEYDANKGLIIPSVNSEDVMSVVEVIDLHESKKLYKKSESDLMMRFTSKDNSIISIEKGSPSFYFVKKLTTVTECKIDTVLQLIPEPERNNSGIFVSWVNNLPDFTEKTLSCEIPFPYHYHSLLVDGTLWYVFQEEGGFRDSKKEMEAKMRCERGEQELFSFFYDSFDDQSEEANGI